MSKRRTSDVPFDYPTIFTGAVSFPFKVQAGISYRLFCLLLRSRGAFNGLVLSYYPERSEIGQTNPSLPLSIVENTLSSADDHIAVGKERRIDNDIAFVGKV